MSLVCPVRPSQARRNHGFIRSLGLVLLFVVVFVVARVCVRVVRCFGSFVLVGRFKLMIIWCPWRAASQASRASTRFRPMGRRIPLMLLKVFATMFIRVHHVMGVMLTRYAPGCPGASWSPKALGI